MKRLISFILILCNIYCYSQEFLGNSDYIYAVGVAKTQTEAENAAYLSLSNKTGIAVTNTARYSISEQNGKISENFEKNIGTDASMVFGDEVQTYIEVGKKKYTVYKYINIKQYVAKQQAIYNKYLASADSISRRCRDIKHSKNLILGLHYLAYKAIDTPLMDVYADRNIEVKNKLRSKTEEIYKKEGPFGFIMLLEKTDPRGYFAIMSGERTKSVHGIEYFRNGKWELPFYFYFNASTLSDDGTSDAFSSKKAKRCLLISDSSKILVRYLYEIEKDGQLYRLDVPENWYFCNIILDTKISNVK